MNNEIKEILDDLKYVSNEIKVHIQDGNIKAKEIPSSLGKELRLNNYSAKILLDYITNLQEEKKQLKDGWQQEVYDRNKILNDWLDLQRRIDKAIEYINDIDEPELRVIEGILKGEE